MLGSTSSEGMATTLVDFQIRSEGNSCDRHTGCNFATMSITKAHRQECASSNAAKDAWRSAKCLWKVKNAFVSSVVVLGPWSESTSRQTWESES